MKLKHFIINEEIPIRLNYNQFIKQKINTHIDIEWIEPEIILKQKIWTEIKYNKAK